MALSHIVRLGDVFSSEKRGEEERGREMMNEGSFKNRKPRGKGGKSAGKRSCLSLFTEAGLAVNARHWLVGFCGASQSEFTVV